MGSTLLVMDSNGLLDGTRRETERLAACSVCKKVTGLGIERDGRAYCSIRHATGVAVIERERKNGGGDGTADEQGAAAGD